MAAAAAAAAGAPAGPGAPAAAQDRTKRSKDIPLFYGQAGKDTISARLLIVRVNEQQQ